MSFSIMELEPLLKQYLKGLTMIHSLPMFRSTGTNAFPVSFAVIVSVLPTKYRFPLGATVTSNPVLKGPRSLGLPISSPIVY